MKRPDIFGRKRKKKKIAIAPDSEIGLIDSAPL